MLFSTLKEDFLVNISDKKGFAKKSNRFAQTSMNFECNSLKKYQVYIDNENETFKMKEPYWKSNFCKTAASK